MLSTTDINKIEELAKSQRKINDLGEFSIIGEKIFNIIENIYSSYILLYPLKTKKIAGFTRKQNNQIQVFINTSLNLNFQIFALAHELYHLINFKNKNYDDFIVCNDKEDVNENFDNNISITYDELKANYFAAAFLLPKYLIKKRFKILKNTAINDEDIFIEILKLEYEFEVPFKTVLKRLIELDCINYNEYKKIDLLYKSNFEHCNMLDINIHEKIKILQSPTLRIYDTINSPKCAVDAYKNSQISFNKMKKTLNIFQKDIDNFNIREVKIKSFDLSSLNNFDR